MYSWKGLWWLMKLTRLFRHLCSFTCVCTNEMLKFKNIFFWPREFKTERDLTSLVVSKNKNINTRDVIISAPLKYQCKMDQGQKQRYHALRACGCVNFFLKKTHFLNIYFIICSYFSHILQNRDLLYWNIWNDSWLHFSLHFLNLVYTYSFYSFGYSCGKKIRLMSSNSSFFLLSNMTCRSDLTNAMISFHIIYS